MMLYLFFAILCILPQTWCGMIAEESCDVLYQCWKQDGKVIAAWRKSDDNKTVDVQLSRPDNGDRNTPLYVAIGLSADGVMGDDFVTECVFVGDVATVHLSWNTGHSNARLPDDHTKVMTELLGSRRSSDELYCHFKQAIMPPQDIGQIANMDRFYYVVYVTGTATDTNINKHEKSPIAFTKQVNLAQTVFAGAMPTGPVAVPINGIPPLVATATRPPPPLPNGVTVGNTVTQSPTSGVTGTSPPIPEPEVTKGNTVVGNSVSEPHPEGEHTDKTKGAEKVTGVFWAMFITLFVIGARV